MSSLIHQGRATYAFFERNWNITKRYWAWELVWLVYLIVNALSVTYIGASAGAITGVKNINVNSFILYLLIGTSVWSYLSVTFDGVTDIINMERWEGTIEYTFMAPISRFTHLIGSCWYAVVHGLLFTFIQLVIVGAFFHLDLSHANYLTAVFMLLVGSVSFIGFGIGAAILPLLYTEKGMQMSFIVRAILLLISGVYYPISVLPVWMRPLASSECFSSDLCPVWFTGGAYEWSSDLVGRDLELYLAADSHGRHKRSARGLRFQHSRTVREENR